MNKTRIPLWGGERRRCQTDAISLLEQEKDRKWDEYKWNITKLNGCVFVGFSSCSTSTCGGEGAWCVTCGEGVPVFSSVERVEMLISCRSSSVSVWKRRMDEPSENAIHTPPPARAMCATLTIGSGWTSNFCNGDNNGTVVSQGNMWRECNHPHHQTKHIISIIFHDGKFLQLKG